MRAFDALILVACAVCAAAQPIHLRTNSLVNPIGIDTQQPLFSWQNESSQPNWTQSAYEIVVSKAETPLSSNPTKIWATGRIASSESLNIRYSGPSLKAQQRYIWAVRVWDAQGKSSSWTQASFETGLLSPSDWKAQWITRHDAASDAEIKAVRWIWLPGVNAEHVPNGSTAHFLYHLHLDDKPQSGSLHFSASADAVAHVNGRLTGHHDNWGAFDREEITDLLHAGDNEIEIDCRVQNGQEKSGDTRAALAASIHVTDNNGHQERIVSDGRWLARANLTDPWTAAQDVGPITMNFGTNISRGPGPGPDRVTTDASLFRKEFTVSSKVISARLSITALGSYSAFLNGKPVAPATLLAPGWTDFEKRVQFQT